MFFYDKYDAFISKPIPHLVYHKIYTKHCHEAFISIVELRFYESDQLTFFEKNSNVTTSVLTEHGKLL